MRIVDSQNSTGGVHLAANRPRARASARSSGLSRAAYSPRSKLVTASMPRQATDSRSYACAASISVVNRPRYLRRGFLLRVWQGGRPLTRGCTPAPPRPPS